MRVPQFWNTFSCGWIWTCKIMECLFRWEAYICCCQFVSSSDITSSFCLHRYRHCHHLQCHCLCFCLCIALCVRIFSLSLSVSLSLAVAQFSFFWFVFLILHCFVSICRLRAICLTEYTHIGSWYWRQWKMNSLWFVSRAC